jgi:hypothetical protein
VRCIGRDLERFALTPKAVEVVEAASFFRENMDDEVREIAQDPFALVVTFHAGGAFADFLQPECDFIRDGLHLFGVGAVANHEIIGKGGDAREVQDLDIGGFFGLRGAYGNEPVGLGSGFGSGTGCEVGFRFGQNLSPSPSYYEISVFYRFAIISALAAAAVFGQETVPDPEVKPESNEVKPESGGLQPDMNDPGVIRAQRDLERVQVLIGQGALPTMRLRKAQEDLENAEDLSILQGNLFGKDLTVEQADQMLFIAQRLVMRREKSMIEMQQLVQSGVISRAEAEASGADFSRAQTELHLAQTRVNLIVQMTEALRIQKNIASLENEAESHPEWAGKVYTKYDGSGIFTASDFQKVSLAYSAKFSKAMPVSADGETATHRALGFDHRGRVDVAVNPDQPEGVWLMGYLQKNRIPYFAFRMAVQGKATGAHIHIGPQSARLRVASTY